MTVKAGFMVPHPPLIIPAVGRGDEKKIPATVAAYEQVAEEISEIKPDTIVVTTPHSIMYLDYFHISPGRKAEGNFEQYRVKGCGYSAEYDEEFVRELCGRCDGARLMAGTMGEQDKSLDHATMIPVHFINEKYTDYKLVRIGLSGQSLIKHYELGELIEQTSKKLGRKTVFIASGDLSHKLKEDGPYGFDSNGPEFDKRIMDMMGKGDFGQLFDLSPGFCSKAGECGHRSFVIMAGAFDRRKVTAKQLSYEAPFGVGYGVCSFYPGEIDEDRDFGRQAAAKEAEVRSKTKEAEDEYVRLARRSLEYYVETGKVLKTPTDLSGELSGKRAGAFVSLKKDGQLRGCIGTISPVRSSLAEEIIENAVSAAAHDPRFSPVRKDELDDIVYSVDVLMPPEHIDSPDMLDVKDYGVIVRQGSKSGLLLPDLEGVDTVEEQINIAKQKAGIGPEEQADLERFRVVRHK